MPSKLRAVLKTGIPEKAEVEQYEVERNIVALGDLKGGVKILKDKLVNTGWQPLCVEGDPGAAVGEYEPAHGAHPKRRHLGEIGIDLLVRARVVDAVAPPHIAPEVVAIVIVRIVNTEKVPIAASPIDGWCPGRN